MAKYILASDFYAHGVGHFKRSSGPFDWREIPDFVVVPKTAKRLDNAPEKPVEVAATIPVLAGQKPQTVEDILRQRMAPPAADPRDEELKRLRQELADARAGKEPEKQPEGGEAGDPGKSEEAGDPALKALLASRDTKSEQGRASGGKASK